MTFKQALDRELEKNPNVGMYIHLCHILQESDSTRAECLKIFNKYMPKEDFLKGERGEMVDYLFKISKPGLD